VVSLNVEFIEILNKYKIRVFSYKMEKISKRYEIERGIANRENVGFLLSKEEATLMCRLKDHL
jgi:hypothetical protein|tara:strand:- start:151 stop:339 length:189 start_codon:yes stop_codon:yes gene_type:complete